MSPAREYFGTKLVRLACDPPAMGMQEKMGPEQGRLVDGVEKARDGEEVMEASWAPCGGSRDDPTGPAVYPWEDNPQQLSVVLSHHLCL